MDAADAQVEVSGLDEGCTDLVLGVGVDSSRPTM